jgi:hypothetical protein
MKTFLKEATILSVYDYHKDERTLVGELLYGIVIKDETNRFEQNYSVITSKFYSQSDFEFITSNDSCCVIDDEAKCFDLIFSEFVVMQNRLYSPGEILPLREILRLNDDRIIH